MSNKQNLPDRKLMKLMMLLSTAACTGKGDDVINPCPLASRCWMHARRFLILEATVVVRYIAGSPAECRISHYAYTPSCWSPTCCSLLSSSVILPVTCGYDVINIRNYCCWDTVHTKAAEESCGFIRCLLASLEGKRVLFFVVLAIYNSEVWTPPINDMTKQRRLIPWKEIREHNTSDDCWLVIQNRVYDASGWNGHPGGPVLFTQAGQDATDTFNAFHSSLAFKDLSQFYIGDVDRSSIFQNASSLKQMEFVRDYRRLILTAKKMGLFDASLLYYAYKVVSNLCILALSWYLCFEFSNIWIRGLAGCILGLYYQQSGWLAHDFLHHAVFKKRQWNDLMGCLVGNVFQGFSVAWWKNKHNKHHSVPNLYGVEQGDYKGDPDIDTMPFLAWSMKLALASQANQNAVKSFLVRYQAQLYFPLLLFARMSWMLQSFFYVFPALLGNGDHLKKHVNPLLWEERFGLCLHYTWNVLFVWSTSMSVCEAAAFILLSQASCGLFLALVFGVGHNGMSVYDDDAGERPDFWRLQVSTTRDITSSPFVDFFMGGLQYQIEHHLFPTMPRHNLPKAHEMVKAFCKHHGIEHRETSLLRGTVEIVQHLDQVSREFISDFPAM